MRDVASVIAANLAGVRERIAAACRQSNRSPDSVRMVAVTKSAEPAWIRTLVAQGIADLGESRPQQLAEHVPLAPSTVRWHLVGHLQRNKVRKALSLAAWIHSVDSLSLLQRIDQAANELEARPRLLLEVNVSGERSKQGFRPDELVETWPAAARLGHADVVGLMTMAPLPEGVESAQATFAALRALRNHLVSLAPQVPLPELSMGMSGDFECAIREGATCIRLGTILFERLERVEK